MRLKLNPESVYLFYKDRWPIEQPPLVAKQLLGLNRAYVFHPEAVARIPEIALLSGNSLSYVAASLPAVPSGFWDKAPKKTAGRLRRALAKHAFPKETAFFLHLQKKDSVTSHVPKGIHARRRQKQELRL